MGAGVNVGTAVRVDVGGTGVCVAVGNAVGVLHLADEEDALAVFPLSVQTWLPLLNGTANKPT